jgi:hypothetical protein
MMLKQKRIGELPTYIDTNVYGSIAAVLFGLDFFSPASQDVYVESSSGNANIVELNIKIEIKPSAVENDPIPWANKTGARKYTFCEYIVKLNLKYLTFCRQN